MMAHIENRSFEILNLKKHHEKLSSLLKSISIKIAPALQRSLNTRSKTFHYNVLCKHYHNGERNFLVNFNVIISALKRS